MASLRVLFAASIWLAALWGRPETAAAEQLRLEIEPTWRGAPLVMERELSVPAVPGLSISRLDGLLSHLALQRADGRWLESDDWRVFWSADRRRLSVSADGIPPEHFQAIRFLVGLDAKTDALDPETWPPEHPLHPDVCGLNWGWKGGYVFLALEGHFTATNGAVSGFSYHLANAIEPMMVQLPVEFSGAHPTTIRLNLRADDILEGGRLIQRSTSTHSRSNDAVALEIKKHIAQAFGVRNVSTDMYQAPAGLQPPAQALPPGTTPYPILISHRLPTVKLPPDNPLTEQGVELGRRLFQEKRLSRNAEQSCANCHEPARAFTDGKPVSRGAEGQTGRRNAMTLQNLAWMREFFWDGRAQTLREQVLHPIQDPLEMNESLERVVSKLTADESYVRQFGRAFGSEGITPQRLALALEQFLLTLIAQESKFDRAARKLATLSPQEQRGLELFLTENDPKRGLRGADCFHCHGGNLFSNQQFRNNGLEERGDDRGRWEVTHEEADRDRFKVPSLRNVALTAPYMHDGRFATIEEVIDHYNGPLHRTPSLDPNLAKHPESGLGLTAEDKAALVAFLKTLTDAQFLPAPAQLPATSLSNTP